MFSVRLWLSPFSSTQIRELLPISYANLVRKCCLSPPGVLPHPARIPCRVSSGIQRIVKITNIILQGLKLFIITIDLEIAWHQENRMFWLLPPAELSRLMKSPSTFSLLGTCHYLHLLLFPSSPQFFTHVTFCLYLSTISCKFYHLSFKSYPSSHFLSEDSIPNITNGMLASSPRGFHSIWLDTLPSIMMASMPDSSLCQRSKPVLSSMVAIQHR